MAWYTEGLARQQAFIQKLNSADVEGEVEDKVNNIVDVSVMILGNLPINQRLLLDSTWQEFQSKLNSYHSDIVKLNAEKKAININVIRLSKTLPLITEQAQSVESLLSESLVSRNQYLELERERIDQEEMLNLERANIEQINASILSAEQNVTAYRAEIRRNTLQEINQLSRQSESSKQELTKAKRLTSLRVLTAPVSGIVEELMVATIGGIVTPAQELLRIVPNAQGLEVEAGLLNKDIGFVHTGQIAEIKIDSFPFTKYGVIDGEVTDISADAVEHEQLGLLFP